ncbi:epilancin biosynthesis-related protein ElxI1, partial [Staphylococcus aureus]
LENIPHLPIILFILMFIFGVPSEMIKGKNNGV